MAAGGVKCWGLNNSGQLGDGTTTNRLAPMDVVGLPASVHVESMSAGGGDRNLVGSITLNPTVAEAGSETCVVANGVALCWGHGALAPVERATDVRVIAARQGNAITRYTLCCQEFGTRSCAVRMDFSVTCWDYRTNSIYRSATIPFSDHSRTVTTGEDYKACALVGSSQIASDLADHVECAQGSGFPSIGDSISTVLTTASGLNPQSITFGTPAPTVIANVGDSLVLTINAGGSGNPVILNSTTPSICSVSGNTVTGLAQGKCIITADQAGNSQYEAAPQATLVLRVGDPLPQTITMGPLPTVVAGGSGTLTATATSGMPVGFYVPSNMDTGACAVANNVVIGQYPATCFITAFQSGDFFWASVSTTAEPRSHSRRAPIRRLPSRRTRLSSRAGATIAPGRASAF